MNNVVRMAPEAKTALIRWIEEHFDEIDEYVASFQLKDGSGMTIYDAYSMRNALGIVGMAEYSLTDGDFVEKKREN